MTAPEKTGAPTWPVRLASELTTNDQRARALVAGLTEDQLNWQPASASWSVGQCLEHLCVTNEAYLPAIAAGLQGKPDEAVENITPGWFGGWFIRKFVEPSPNTIKARAPSKIKPTEQVGLAVLDRFLASNEACRELIGAAHAKNVNKIRFWNPLVPGIRFTVGTGLQLVASHGRRHLLQGERMRNSANFPA